MPYSNLVVIVPSHSLEDFPTDVTEPQAESLLNAFACVWHPALLAQAKSIPTWAPAEMPPSVYENRLVFVPSPSSEWLPPDWVEQARAGGAVVVTETQSRDDYLAAAFGPLEDSPNVDAELAADFLALGTCWLQMELLSRRMHYFDTIDEAVLERESIAAAEHVVGGNLDAARAHLRATFEHLLESRERFYPIDCYILDLCLLMPRVAAEQRSFVTELLAGDVPVNFIQTAQEWDELAEQDAELIGQVKSAWNEDRIDLLGGDYRDAPLPALAVGSVLWEFDEGRRVFRRLFDRVPTCWGRRRYGLSSQMPQVLNKYGYDAALHIVMDDGIYPDDDQSKFRWEGCDGTVIDAVSRFPVPAEGAGGYLRLPTVMAESMEQDQSAAVLFARWPEVKSPWFHDLRHINKYAPVLGRFATLRDFIDSADDYGHQQSFEQHEYLTPFFSQAVAKQDADPISRFAAATLRRQRFEAADYFCGMTDALSGRAIDVAGWGDKVERIAEQAGPDADAEAVAAATEAIDTFMERASNALADVVMHGVGDEGEAGVLLLNSECHARTVAVDLPQLKSPPPMEGPVKAVQFDDARQSVVCEIAGCGFLWLPLESKGTPPAKAGPPLAEDHRLQNEFFEVVINETTGGISRIKEHGRTPNRLSQQIAFRFPHERTVPVGPQGEEGGDEEKTFYSAMRKRSTEITGSGPAMGEIVTTGDIFDQADGSRLAGYRQAVRVWRKRKTIEVDLELDPATLPEGNPWMNYYALRFAWNDITAALTRTVQQGAHGLRGERFESGDYLEIASDDERVTLLFHGRPFHRKTGPRMLDTLLLVEGETQRKFKYSIAFDEEYPMIAARDATTPVTVIPTTGGPPRSGPSGWFIHLTAKNVQLLAVTPLLIHESESGEDAETPAGFCLRLLETEGRNRSAKLRCFRTPKSARLRDFEGRTRASLPIEGDAVVLNLSPHEIADVELHF